MDRIGWICLATALLVLSCNLLGPQPTQTSLPFPETPQALPEASATLLSLPTASPTDTPTSLPPSPVPKPVTATPPPTSTVPAAQQQVKIFLIALEDNGQSGQAVGCGDSVVGVEVQIEPTQAVLRAALTKLLSLRERNYGQSGLYNALYQSDLSIDKLAIQDGEAIIQLKGKLLLGGVCDSPRVKAQLEETALQFSTVTRVSVFINGIPLDQLLSER